MSKPWMTLVLSLACVLASCQRAGSPIAPTSVAALDLVAHAITAGGITDALVPFELSIDPDTLTGTLTPAAERAAGQYQGLVGDLDAAKFLKPDTLRPRSITRAPNGDVRLTVEFTHPFPVPTYQQPASVTNRADLGFTGRLLVLSDLPASEVAANTFFGDVVVNPEVLSNADGYVDPGDLLLAPSTSTTAYPYKLLVDDYPSFGQLPTGNYQTAAGGWQHCNMGYPDIAWRGYDYIHQGQSSIVNLDFRPEALGSPGGAPVRLALLVRYLQPKGTPADHLPVYSGYDVADFAYRLPFGALDCSRVLVNYDFWGSKSPLPFEVGSTPGSRVQIRAVIRDWDATAREADDPDLSQESDITLVQPGGSGWPTVEFHCPALGPTVSLLPHQTEFDRYQGHAYFSGFAPNTSLPKTGPYLGLIRVTDPEASNFQASAYHYGLDPVTIVPSLARAVAPVTYQTVPILVQPHDPGVSWIAGTVDTSLPQTYIVQPIPRPTSALLADGHVAVAYYTKPTPTATPRFMFARGLVDTPQSPDDWTFHEFRTPASPTTRSEALAMLVRQSGEVVILSYTSGEYSLSLSSTPTPSSQADWQSLLPPYMNTLESLVETPAARLLLGGWSNSVTILTATIETPLNEDDWSFHTLGGYQALGTAPGGSAELAILADGRPATLYSFLNGLGGLWFATANSLAPLQSSDWTSHAIPAPSPTIALSMAIPPAANPAICTVDLQPMGPLSLIRATTPFPASAADWGPLVAIPATTSIGYPPQVLSLAGTSDGRLALVILPDSGWPTILRSTIPDPTAPGDWLRGVPDPDPAAILEPMIGDLIVLPDGRLGLSSYDPRTQQIRYAQSVGSW